MIETAISAKLVHSLRHDYKAKILKLHGHAMQEPGWPDLYIAHPKFVGWIETKGVNTLVKTIQRTVMEELAMCNVDVFILTFLTENHYSIEDKDDFILVEFSFPVHKWMTGAGLLLDHLNGLRNHTRL